MKPECERCGSEDVVQVGPDQFVCRACLESDEEMARAEEILGREDYAADAAYDASRHDEGVNFDKFMDSIVIKEHRETKVDEKEKSASRIIAKQYREKAHNRIRFVPGGNR